MNLFEVRLPLRPEKQLHFRLVYQHVLRRRNGCYRHVVSLEPGGVVADFLAHVTVEESKALSKFEVLPLQRNVSETDGLGERTRWERWAHLRCDKRWVQVS